MCECVSVCERERARGNWVEMCRSVSQSHRASIDTYALPSPRGSDVALGLTVTGHDQPAGVTSGSDV